MENSNDTSKKSQTTMDDLAVMVQKGFESMGEEMKKEFRTVREEIKEVKNELKSEIEDVKVGLNQRVHIFDHKDLEHRVEKVEGKVGIEAA